MSEASRITEAAAWALFLALSYKWAPLNALDLLVGRENREHFSCIHSNVVFDRDNRATRSEAGTLNHLSRLSPDNATQMIHQAASVQRPPAAQLLQSSALPASPSRPASALWARAKTTRCSLSCSLTDSTEGFTSTLLRWKALCHPWAGLHASETLPKWG